MKSFISILYWSVITGLVIVGLHCLIGCNGNLTKDVHDLQSSQDQQNSRLDANEAQIADLEAQLATLQAVLAALPPNEPCNASAIALLQSQINAILERLSRAPGHIRD